MTEDKSERIRRPMSAITRRFPTMSALNSTGAEISQLMTRILTGQVEAWDPSPDDPSIQACPWRPLDR